VVDRLAALTEHGQGALPTFETEIVDVGAECFEDAQPLIANRTGNNDRSAHPSPIPELLDIEGSWANQAAVAFGWV
jgi:hypothetical protein